MDDPRDTGRSDVEQTLDELSTTLTDDDVRTTTSTGVTDLGGDTDTDDTDTDADDADQDADTDDL